MQATLRPSLLPLLFGLATLAAAQEPSLDHGSAGADGEKLFNRWCYECHRGPGKSNGPTLAGLQRMSSDQVLTSMTAGKMQEQAEHLSSDEIFAITNYLTAGSSNAFDAMPQTAWCSEERRSISTARIDLGGWSADLQNSRYQPNSTISRDNVSELEVAWVFGLPDVADARSQPVVTEDTVFVAAISGNVFALDRASGCIKWAHDTNATLRTSMSLGKAGDQEALFVGDMGAKVYAVAAHTGEPLWTTDTALFPASVTTGTPVPWSDPAGERTDRLYVPISAFGVVLATNPKFECCKSHGAVSALDAASGEILWTTHMTKDAEKTYVSEEGVQQWGPSGVPVWTTPTIDDARNQLYVGTGENTSTPATLLSDSIVALDLDTGAVRWAFQGTQKDAFNMACGRRKGPNCPKEDGPDFDFGAAAVLTQDSDGRELVVAGQKSGEVHALDPDTGKVVWQNRLSQGSALGGIHWGIAAHDGKVFVPIADPPFPRPGYTPKPGVHALDLASGEILWTHLAERRCELDMKALRNPENPWPDCPFQYSFSAAPMVNDQLLFAAALDGRVYAFDTASGEILWQDQTVRAFEAVNGIDTHGGSIDNSGVQLAGDLLLVQSGYSLFGQLPGNALIAYRIPGK